MGAVLRHVEVAVVCAVGAVAFAALAEPLITRVFPTQPVLACTPTVTMLVLDRSGSLREDPEDDKMLRVQDAVGRFAARAREDACVADLRAGLVTFARDATLDVAPTADLQHSEAVARSVVALGGTIIENGAVHVLSVEDADIGETFFTEAEASVFRASFIVPERHSLATAAWTSMVTAGIAAAVQYVPSVDIVPAEWIGQGTDGRGVFADRMLWTPIGVVLMLGLASFRIVPNRRVAHAIGFGFVGGARAGLAYGSLSDVVVAGKQRSLPFAEVARRGAMELAGMRLKVVDDVGPEKGRSTG